MIRILLSTRLGERRWTQADLARATGIRPSTINDLYHEIAERVNLEHLDLICEALGCELSDLMVRMESERQYKKDVADREKRIDELTAELDKELEWKPSDSTGTNMEQKSYEELAKYGKVMTDDEAKAFIADECGFAPEKIHILHEVNTYEVNKHRRLRKSATFDRAPVYESTDWNYVRFDCAYFMYELVNGELRFYSC